MIDIMKLVERGGLRVDITRSFGGGTVQITATAEVANGAVAVGRAIYAPGLPGGIAEAIEVAIEAAIEAAARNAPFKVAIRLNSEQQYQWADVPLRRWQNSPPIPQWRLFGVENGVPTLVTDFAPDPKPIAAPAGGAHIWAAVQEAAGVSTAPVEPVAAAPVADPPRLAMDPLQAIAPARARDIWD